jgi:hypothetical protein
MTHQQHDQTDVSNAVLAALQNHNLKAQRKRGTYKSNCPWRADSDSMSFEVCIDPAWGGGGWYNYYAGDEHGNFIELAQKLDIPLNGASHLAPNTKRQYTTLADYETLHYANGAFDAAGWRETSYKGRPALVFDTASGKRWRFLDDQKPSFISELGYTACWYGLDRAVKLAKKHRTPLIVCNGEPSVVAAQSHDVAACAVTSGERGTLPDALLDELKAAWSGAIVVALDCDSTGRKSAASLAVQLKAAGYDARAVDLKGGKGFDLADFCGLYREDSIKALKRLASFTDEPKEESKEYVSGPSLPIDVNDLLAMERRELKWFAKNFLREGLGLLVGQPNVGKTPLAAQLAIAIAMGNKWMNMIQCPQDKVLYLGMEYSSQELIPLFDISRMGQQIPRGYLAIKTIEDDFPTTPEAALAELEYYLQLGFKVIIIDVLTAFLPPEKFKQNVYLGDYSELKPYHRLALQYNACILGVWHASKRESDPKLMYNGSTGMWAACASRLTMYQDQDQRVRIVSFPRMGDKVEWGLTQEQSKWGRRWVVTDADPEPVCSPTELTIYRCIREHADKSRPFAAQTIADMTGLEVRTVRTLLPKMAETNKINKSRIGDGYYIEKAVAPIADVADVAPIADVASCVEATSVALTLPKNDDTDSSFTRSESEEKILLNLKQREQRDSTSNDDSRAATSDESVFDSVPEGKLFYLRMYLRSGKDADQERAKELCESYGVDYAAALAYTATLGR